MCGGEAVGWGGVTGEGESDVGDVSVMVAHSGSYCDVNHQAAVNDPSWEEHPLVTNTHGRWWGVRLAAESGVDWERDERK